MAERELSVSVRANSKKLKRDLRRAEKRFKSFGKKAARDLKQSFSKLKGTLKSAVGIGGVVGFAALGKEVFDFEKKLTRLGIQSGRSTGDMAKFRDQIAQVSNQTGQGRETLVDAAAQFVSLTGDMDTASSAMGLFGKIATATGADMTDVAKTAAALTNNLGITAVEDMERAFAGMAAQGKAGAIELRDLATLLPGLAPQFVQFEEKGVDALRSLGANLQIVRNNFGSAEEAATGMRALLTAVAKKAPQLKKLGVDVFKQGPEGEKTLRNFQEIVREVDNLGLSQTQLIKTFGRVEAVRAFLALQQGGIQGFEKFNVEGFKAGTIAKDFERFNESAAGRIAKSWNKVKETLLKLFTPERIERFVQAMEKLARIVGFVADNALGLAAAFAGMKLGAFTAKFVMLGRKLTAAGGGVGKLVGGFGLLQAALTGFAIGTALDELLGLSDKIVNNLLLSEDVLNRISKTPTFITREDRTGALVERGTLEQAQARGIIDQGGRFQPGAERKLREIAAAEQGFALDEVESFGQGSIFDDRVKELQANIRSALKGQAAGFTPIRAPFAAGQAPRDVKVQVSVGVEKDGLIRVKDLIQREGNRTVTQ